MDSEEGLEEDIEEKERKKELLAFCLTLFI